MPEYRRVCFNNFERKCAICGWDLVVDVHHINYNHKDNSPTNLIPLCPNHHSLTKTHKYKSDIDLQIAIIMESKFQEQV